MQIHLPSLSWAELYTCQLSSGLVGSTWRGAGGAREREGEKVRPQSSALGMTVHVQPPGKGRKKWSKDMC